MALDPPSKDKKKTLALDGACAPNMPCTGPRMFPSMCARAGGGGWVWRTPPPPPGQTTHPPKTKKTLTPQRPRSPAHRHAHAHTVDTCPRPPPHTGTMTASPAHLRCGGSVGGSPVGQTLKHNAAEGLHLLPTLHFGCLHDAAPTEVAHTVPAGAQHEVAALFILLRGTRALRMGRGSCGSPTLPRQVGPLSTKEKNPLIGRLTQHMRTPTQRKRPGLRAAKFPLIQCHILCWCCHVLLLSVSVVPWNTHRTSAFDTAVAVWL